MSNILERRRSCPDQQRGLPLSADAIIAASDPDDALERLTVPRWEPMPSVYECYVDEYDDGL